MRSVAFCLAQDALCNERENELLSTGCNTCQEHLPVEALDVIFLCVAETPMGHDRIFAGRMTCTRAQELRCVGLRSTRPTAVIQPGGFHHQVEGGLELDPVGSQRMLNPLVL